MAGNYRHTGLRVAITSASNVIASGALVFQEGEVGIALTGAAQGESFTLQRTGTFVVPVPVGTVKGDSLYHALGGESVALTLQRAAATYFIGKAESDRDSDGKALVHINPAFSGASAATLTIPQAAEADVTLTLLAGTANGVTQAIPDPADTPADADALRDDIVTNVLPAVRNNIAEVGTTLNALLAKLRTAGIITP